MIDAQKGVEALEKVTKPEIGAQKRVEELEKVTKPEIGAQKRAEALEKVTKPVLMVLNTMLTLANGSLLNSVFQERPQCILQFPSSYIFDQFNKYSNYSHILPGQVIKLYKLR